MSKVADVDKNLPILVVDEHSTVRRVVKNCLAKLGFKNITEAESGELALEKLSENKFNLLISEWKMPDIAASELMQKAGGGAAQVPCIMLVSPAQKKLVQKEQIPQNADVIVKPFTVNTLEEKLEKLL